MRKRTVATSIVAAAGLAVIGLSSPAGAATPSAKSTVRNSLPTWTASAKSLGRASSSGGVSLRVYLAPRGGTAALQAAVAKVSDPKSASYRSFISARQFHAQYDPTAATVAAVRSWLKANHLTVTSVAADNRYLSVHGTVLSAEQAFGTSINRYTHKGQAVQANATPLTVPAALASAVLTVSGVDTTPKVTTHADSTPAAAPPAAFQNARPCSIYYGQLTATKAADFHTPLPAFQGKALPYAVCGYTGPQLRSAYEGNTELDGTGVTVAITDAYASPTIVNDVSRYAGLHGDGSYLPGQFTQTKATAFTHQAACGPSGWYGEESLDIEAVHAMAPGANIHFYGGASCEDADLLAALVQVVDDDSAQLVTNSWLDPESGESADTVAAYEDVFLQGALQGQSFMFSSGDDGDELANTGIRQASYPASDPYATAVGGTSDAINGSSQFSFQTGWGTQKYSLNAAGTAWSPLGFIYGAGGGPSSLFNQPSYQAGVVPSSQGPSRAVPDVGLDADPTTGMLIGITQTFPGGDKHYGEYRIGGTSLASPLFAGMTALTLQHAGSAIGLLNPTIYSQAGTSSFKDIKGQPKDAGNVRVDYANSVDATGGLLYSVRTFNQDSSLQVKPGWDNVTGIGSPTPSWLTSIAPLTAK